MTTKPTAPPIQSLYFESIFISPKLRDVARLPLSLVDLDQPDVSFDRFDYVVHLSIPYLFGHAKREALGGVEGNMRRQRKRVRIDYRIDDDRPGFVSKGFRKS